MWRRWSREYLAALRERHNCNGKGKARPLKPGDVLLIRSEEKNQGKWPLVVVVELFNGRDGIVRGVKLRAGKTFLDRPIQHLYSMELACNRAPERAEVLTPLNAKAPVFRPRRDAAVAANLRIRDAIVKNFKTKCRTELCGWTENIKCFQRTLTFITLFCFVSDFNLIIN